MAVIEKPTLFAQFSDESLFLTVMQRVERVEYCAPVETEALISKSYFSRRWDAFEQISKWSIFFETLSIAY